VVRSCENSNGPFDSLKGGEFLGHVGVYYVAKKDSAPWSWLPKACTPGNTPWTVYRSISRSQPTQENVSIYLFL
jgi:hypothetical protein